MLKVQKKDGVWQARLVGRPSKDLITALRSLFEVAHVIGPLEKVICDDSCLGRDCDECEIGGCDPVEAAESFATQMEIDFPVMCGFSVEDVNKWDVPIDPTTFK
jgi:hypothetical protein